MNENEANTQSGATREWTPDIESGELNDVVDFVAYHMFTMTTELDMATTRYMSVLDNYKVMKERAEQKIADFMERHSDIAVTSVSGLAKSGTRFVDTPWGRLGLRKSQGSVSQSGGQNLDFWETEFPHVVEQVSVKKVNLSALTPDDKERLAQMQANGMLPGFVAVSPPNPDKLYFKPSSKHKEDENV